MKPSTVRDRGDGSITVFVSLLLPLIISMIGVSLESARSSGMEMRLRLAADASIESVFAEYDDALWGTFHLLFRSAGDRSGDKLQTRVMSYAETGLGTGVNLLGKYTDWFTLHPSSVEISDMVFATDQHGAVFEQAVLDYMKSGIITILIDEMISRLGVFSDGEAKDKLDESSGKGDFSFNSIYGDYKDLKKTAEEAKLEEERRKAEEARENGETVDGEGDAGTGDSQPEEEPPQETPGLTLDDILETIKNLMMHGFMGVVVDNPNSISHTSFVGSDFPSRLSSGEKGRHAELSPVSMTASSGAIKDRLLVDEYLLRFLDCYTSEDKPDEDEDMSTPEYQVEYIIAGKSTDYDNLKSVVNRLLWLREGLNMAYLLSDSGKREAAVALATALITPTGQLYLITPAAGLLLAAWAFAESLRDVKALLAGGRIPLLKTAATWKTSLENISSDIASAANTLGEDELPTGSGLTYVDYLRIFLAFVNPENRNYRGMDMIQVVMKKTKSDFKMTQCVYACSATLTAAGPYRFLVFSHILPSGKEGGYNLSCKTWFGYKRRKA